MKYIKSINEFFDSEELKAGMEIEYLQNKIPFKEMVKDINIAKQKDLLLSKLSMNCPFIIGLNYTRINSSLVQIGFQNILDNTNTFFVIEVMSNNNDKYLCNVYAKCIGKYTFDESKKMNLSSYKDLVNFINHDALDILINFTNFTEKTFNYKFFPFTNRNDVSKLQGTISYN